MTAQGAIPNTANRVSGVLLIALSLIALSPLVYWLFYPSPPQADEGTGAHIFQLAVAAQVPVLLVFLATADWQRPLRSLSPLAVQVVVMAVAFLALYRFEYP